MNTLQDIGRAHAEGRIDREAFWRAMQARHFILGEYQALLAPGELAAIELTASELRVVTADGIRLVWHPEDLRTAPNVLVNTGVYEPDESRLLAGAAAQSTIIFDVGANIGFYSLHWAKQVAHRSDSRVHAFEPVPTTFDRLARNIALNQLGGVITANNIGLGAVPTTLTMFVPAFSGSGAASIRNLHPDEASTEVAARIDTLDAYVARTGVTQLDLMKIDVEGNELAVLLGGMATIAAYRPLLFMELLRKWSKPFGYHPNDVIVKLRALGYRCFALVGGGLAVVDTIDEETVQTNFFFAHDRHAAWLRENGIS